MLIPLGIWWPETPISPLTYSVLCVHVFTDIYKNPSDESYLSLWRAASDSVKSRWTLLTSPWSIIHSWLCQQITCLPRGLTGIYKEYEYINVHNICNSNHKEQKNERYLQHYFKLRTLTRDKNQFLHLYNKVLHILYLLKHKMKKRVKIEHFFSTEPELNMMLNKAIRYIFSFSWTYWLQETFMDALLTVMAIKEVRDSPDRKWKTIYIYIYL